ncbi:MAG: S8 family peptidase [Calditrichaeota bacterium]|nr:S8 family peptidase [Calditrichota bacterium]HQU74032.1 S8/S53 family peptidase [Calditrichia bacterium]
MRYLSVWVVVFVLGLILFFPLSADDLVRQETGVSRVHNELGIRGAGAIVAILDRGIDYEHPDFRNPDGTTRILYIYDMTDPQGANDPDNPYGIGTIYDAGEINAALSSGNRLATRDAVGHGTASAGLAAGNGAASSGMYAGMAPLASIIVVKITTEGAPAHDGEPAEAAFYQPTYVPVAMDFCIDKAAEVHLPVVMLANFGSIQGPMDGTSTLARELDSRFGPGHPGRVFITGSSDDGGWDNHAQGTVVSGDTATITMTKSAGNLRVDLWYNNADRFDVQLVTPGGVSAVFASPASNALRSQQNTGEFAYYHNGSDVDFFGALNDRREILIDFTGAAGDYAIRLIGATVASGEFQASLNPGAIIYNNNNRFTSYVVPGYTVWDLASAHNNVCPNSYVNRQFWTDINGVTRTYPGNDAGVGNLWTGSGVGPTFDGRTGVTVSVPGNTNFGAYAPRSYFASLGFTRVAGGDGQFGYGTLGAVSGAAPVLTGIVALMLDADSTLDSEEVKTLLQQYAREDSFTGTVPNARWGGGKADAFATVNAIISTNGIGDAGPDGLPETMTLRQNYPNPFNPTTQIRFALKRAAPTSLKVYDVRGSLIATLVDGQLPAGHHSVTFSGENLASGIYLYRLRSGNREITQKMMLIR